MSITKNISIVCRNGDTRIRGEVDLIGSGGRSVDHVVAAESSETLSLPIDVSALKLFYIVSDRAVNCEFAGPNVAVTLAPNVPFMWFFGSAVANPFGSTDVTTVFIENEFDAGDARVQIEVLTDVTP